MLGDVHEYMCASNGSACMMDFSMWGISWWERRLVTLFSNCGLHLYETKMCINVYIFLLVSKILWDTGIIIIIILFLFFFILLHFFLSHVLSHQLTLKISDQLMWKTIIFFFLLKFKILISMWLDYVSGPLLSEFIFSSFHQKLLHMSAICTTGVA